MTTIEFKTIPTRIDVEDLSQECTAYMKTKQFMANRIHQQQEEIDMLKQHIIYHSGREIQMYEMIKTLSEEIEMLKKIKNVHKEKGKDDSLCDNEDNAGVSLSDDFATSLICDEKDHLITGYETINAVTHQDKRPEEIKMLKEENLDLQKENEKLSLQILENTLEINKVKSDKFILFNELNELIMSLKKINIDELNEFYKKHRDSRTLTKSDMPLSKGIKYNILSAQSQITKLLRIDTIHKKLSTMEEENKSSKVNSEGKIQLEIYLNLLKSTEIEFDELLDRKLSKRGKSFFYY